MSMLLVDSCQNNYVNMQINESSNGRMRFRGKFQAVNEVNKNGRIYSENVLRQNVEALSDLIKKRGLVGELDHPTDSIVHYEKASHVITKLWWDGNNLMGEGETLNTPYGRTLRALLEDGIPPGISSRGVGSGKTNEQGHLVISEGYKLITFDVVADPSTHGAFQQKITGEGFSHSPQFIPNYSVKNTSSSIDKVNKDALIAALGGIINNYTSNLKRG